MNETQTSQGEAPEAPAGHEAPVGFFAVGIVINLVLLAAYFVWAYRNWKKPGPRDEP